MEYSFCTKCKKDLTIDKFVKRKNGDCLKRCIECNAKDQLRKNRVGNSKIESINEDGSICCIKCKVDLPTDKFIKKT